MQPADRGFWLLEGDRATRPNATNLRYSIPDASWWTCDDQPSSRQEKKPPSRDRLQSPGHAQRQARGESPQPGAASVLNEPPKPQLFASRPTATAEPKNDSLAWYRVNVNTSKQPERRARARTTGTLVGTRFQAELLEAIDLWRRAQSDLPTRPEAVRRLVELGMRDEDGAPGGTMSTAKNSARRGP